MTTAGAPTYRADIDGLRGVAVVAVVTFEFIGAAYFLLAGLLAANVWEAFRRWRVRRPAGSSARAREEAAS